MKSLSSRLKNPTATVRSVFRAFFVAAAAVLCLLSFAVPASALTLIVDDLESDDPDPVLDGNCETSLGACTLRAAMMEINGPSGETANTINFDLSPGVHTLQLTNDLPIMYRNVDVIGPGSDYGVIEGQGLYRIFSSQTPATYFFVGYLTLKNASGNAGGAAGAYDGATFIASKVVFEGNHATNGGAVYCQGCEAFISKCRFSENQASNSGGAIYVLQGGYLNDMHDVLFEANTAGSGGAIGISGSSMSVSNAIFEGNTSTGLGGALSIGLSGGYFMNVSNSSFMGNEATSAGASGGAVYLFGSDGRAVFNGVTFSGNSSGLLGGAIYAYYANSPNITIGNSTVTGNSAGWLGGGIHYQDPDRTIQLSNVTVTGNKAGSVGGCSYGCGGGLYGLFSVRNSIIAGNSDLDPQTTPSPDCRGNFYSGGYNIIGDDSICSVIGGEYDQIDTDPVLGSLAKNGGPTLTHALLSGSPAIDGGNTEGCYWDHDADRGAASPELLLTIDQRTVTRPYNTVCDIGSYERTNCDDGVQNNGETGIDCGGGGCAVCSCIDDDFAATNGTTYSSMQGAYDATWDGAEIKTREVDTGEVLTFDRPAYITLIGGHDCDFFRIRGMTTVSSLTVSAGRLTVENIAIGGP